MAKWYDQRRDVRGNKPAEDTKEEPDVREKLDKAEKESKEKS